MKERYIPPRMFVRLHNDPTHTHSQERNGMSQGSKKKKKICYLIEKVFPMEYLYAQFTSVSSAHTHFEK